MKQFTVLLFCICILALSFYGSTTNSFYVQILMNISTLFIYARIALVAVLLLYVFVPSIRTYTTRSLVSAGGILMLLTGIISIGSPSLLGYTSNYILLGDSLTLIEAGILAITLSAELSARSSQFIVNGYNNILSVLATPVKMELFVHTTNRVVSNTTFAQRLINKDSSVPMFK